MQLIAAVALPALAAPRPHIVQLIADDFGWANVGYHRSPGDGGGAGEVVTPNIDGLVKAGVELERHYAFQFCSPSRSSFQSGRLPVHVNTKNADPTVHNPADPIGGFAGIPVNMTGIAQKMRAAGYRAHMVGKWDAGMATPRHSPFGRGYESWLGYFDAFSFIDNEQRMKYASMVKYMDDAVGLLISSVKAKAGMWDTTLVVFTSDNGGPLYTKWPLEGGAGANNWPLKGGKFSDWEGGVRTVAFVSGGFLPEPRRGTQLGSLVHIADWYATFCGLAGVAAPDDEAAAAGLPPIDSIDQWAHISGANATAPRVEVHLSEQALIQGTHKVLVGKIDISDWQAPSFPNNTCKPTLNPWKCQPLFPGIAPVGLWTQDCGDSGCFFDVYADPTEHSDLAAEQPAAAAALVARLKELNAANYDPKRGTGSKAACTAAEAYGGFYGPFVGVTADSYICTNDQCVAGAGGSPLATCQSMCG